MNGVCTLRVTSIRSQNPRGFGGCIFTGVVVDSNGNVPDASDYYVVKATGALLGEIRIQPGQWWRILGEPLRNVIKVNGYDITEWQIEPTELTLVLPSGEYIIEMMAQSPDFKGVGRVKARRLWETFRDGLYTILDRGDADALTVVLTEECAHQTVLAWRQQGDTRALQWLHTHGVDVAVGRNVVAFFGSDTLAQIEADPYRLLSFCAGWRYVDALARDEFGIAERDPRRLQGAIEEALYQLFGAGHTCVRLSMLVDRLRSILSVPECGPHWSHWVADVLAQGLSNGSYVIGSDHDIHPVGPLVMEMTVARAVAERLGYVCEEQLLLSPGVDACIDSFERLEGIAFNHEQRLAIKVAATRAFAVITGGAGVGKTTVLKGLHYVFDQVGIRIFQVALAGRAAKRMQEATGRPAFTIAGFLLNTSVEQLEGPAVVVVDEASMCDIITMYRLCELLPAHVRIVLVGDPNQLMPVGPGLVLHALTETPEVPSVELKDVKRYGGMIADLANAVRSGISLDLPSDESAAIALIPCGLPGGKGSDGQVSSIAETVFRLYAQSPGESQILSARRRGEGGVFELNALCQKQLAGDAPSLLVWDEGHQSMAWTGFRLGDPVLCTRNLWEIGLQNGSLGKLVQIEIPPRLLYKENGDPLGEAIGWVRWDDGERRPLFEFMLKDLELGYAITVHKAQGSQWPRIIVPVTDSRLLDRTLVYTAITRAQRQVLLVGDPGVLRSAVERLPRSQIRQVALGALLRSILDSNCRGSD